jgi:phosphatidylglycerol lysyltransferase
MNARRLRALGPLLAFGLLGIAFWMLQRQLRGHSYTEIQHSLSAIGADRLALALGLTVASYFVLTGYDTLALRYLGRPLRYRRRALAAFLGYVFSYNLGLNLLGGAAPRYRLYTRWGLTALEIATLIGFVSLTFWLGGLTLAAVAFVGEPAGMTAALRLPQGVVLPVGVVLAVLVGIYLFTCTIRRTPFTLRGWTVSLPSPPMAVSQLVLSVVDWSLAASVLYVLLPPAARVSYPYFLGLFVVAEVGGVLSNVPAGLGVFETIVILSLRPLAAPPSVLGALVAFRLVYYLLPLAVATAALAAYEIRLRWEHLDRARSAFGLLIPELAPRLLAVTTFVGGTLLLVSGVTPAAPGRLAWLQDFLPLPVLQLSHFLGSVAGVGLVLLASSLHRRLDAAYHLTMALLGAGAVFSVLKGFDYEEAVILIAMLAMLAPCRPYFHRRASVISERFTPIWTLSVIVVIGGSTWLGFFAYRHVEYTRELWWQFSLFADAPRFLRATVGVVGTAIVFAIAHLLGPAAPRMAPPDTDTMEAVAAVVSASQQTYGHLALLGDKSFLLSPDRQAFLMYAISGRSWVAMGDPVGAEDQCADLVWRFRELCDRYAAWPVFYEVSAERLPLYVDVGLQPLKFGEEARVRLATFTLAGRANREMRHTVTQVEREGATFEVLPREAVPALVAELKVVSNTWLAEKHTREKGFSLGFFDLRYLARLPLAVVRTAGGIVAFANVWCGAGHHEVAPDLMRYRSDGPARIMDYLFIRLILWAREQGYEWFNLGMAPLAGLESRSMAPLWHRLGAFAYLYGEPFYNFQGLRQFKEKFHPEWSPKYLVSPGGLVLPRVVANVAALVSGGLRGVITK